MGLKDIDHSRREMVGSEDATRAWLVGHISLQSTPVTSLHALVA